MLDQETVLTMNFGGGVYEPRPENENENGERKNRKDIYEEIIAKSKAYKMVNQEIKMANEQLREDLDDQLDSLLPLMNFNRQNRDKNLDKETKVDKTYEMIAHELREMKRVQP